MERERLFEELLSAAQKLGVEVRVEPFETGTTSAFIWPRAREITYMPSEPGE